MDYIKRFEIEIMKLNPEADEYFEAVDDLIESIPEEKHEALIPVIFRFFEKYPLEEYGSPGSLVHLVEEFYPNYKDLLLESLDRQPSYMGIWMTNRILNAKLTEADRNDYHSALEKIRDDSGVHQELRDEAAGFLELQAENGN